MKAFVLAALFAAVASPVLADDLSLTVGATTNYMARGTSQTYGQPAYQAVLDYSTDGGVYGGAFVSTVDFQEGTNLEFDPYVGYRTKIGAWDVDAMLISINYGGDADVERMNWNMIEADVTVSRQFGDWKVGTKVGYSPDYFNFLGESLWVEEIVSYAVDDRLTIGGSVAKQFLADDWSYSTYNIGVTYAVTPALSVDARWSDTDRHDLDASYDGATSLTVRKTF